MVNELKTNPKTCGSRLQIIQGVTYLPHYLDDTAQNAVLEAVRKAVRAAPLYRPVMPRSGRPLSVQMTNLGPLGWITDKAGYRYQAHHPETGKPWPPIPEALLQIWQSVSDHAAPPQACLVNFYNEDAKLGLHRDEDEQTFDAPVVSISLGDTAQFRLGGPERKDKTQSLKLSSGDVLVMGGPARLNYHGVGRIYPGTSTLLKQGGRINLTMRRVTPK